MKTYVFFGGKIEADAQTKNLIRKAVRTTLRSEKFPEDAEVSVTLTDNEEIHVLNREYRGVDRPTDVLSFPMAEDDDNIGDYDMDKNAVLLGDIVVSVEKIEEQAKEYMHSFERELAYLVIHSTLHLLGYDHETGDEDEKEMTEKQDKIIESMGL
ncbi:MAG: rRNA maturation RNase YbeY [Clostridia bacterium]|nr:rRNA maturation RNase YbeY [Clostridia bacterium]